MARKPTLSPTRLTTFLACPVKYRWTYVDPRGRPYLRSRSYYSFGTSLHRVLERFHDANDAGVSTVGDAMRIFEETWVDAGYRSQEEMEQAQGYGRRIVQEHVERTLARPTEGRVLAVERRFRTEYEDFALLGVVDRLDVYPDGRLDVVDYKSGRADVSEGDVRGDVAMGTYALLVRKVYPDRRITASIHALRTGKSATVEFDPETIETFEMDLLELSRTILGTEWDEKAPVPKTLCRSCDFLPLCSRDPRYDPAEIPDDSEIVHTREPLP